MSSTSRRVRLDRELVRRGLVRSRQSAQEVIAQGRVTVDGAPAAKPSALVGPWQNLAVTGGGRRWVSRGGDKLAGALAALRVPVAGRICLDAGASTGGFTDVLLDAGARCVIAVDVGYGQLAWTLRNDPRVVVLERTHVRALDASQLDGHVPELVVADLSFISLATVLPALRAVADPGADWCLLVKPQFEAGPGFVRRGGVVRDPDGWRTALDKVRRAAIELGLRAAEGTVSPLPGPAGNIEFFLWLRTANGTDWEVLRERLIADGCMLRDTTAG